MDETSWTEEMWQRALKISRRRWFPTVNPAVKCGFCIETLKSRERTALMEAGDHPVGNCDVCPIKRLRPDCGTHSVERSPEEVLDVQEFLRSLGMEHGVMMDEKEG